MVIVTLIQLPLFFSWYIRSCAFLTEFVKFWALTQFTRLSIVGLIEDGIWYTILKGLGWRDLCPYCSERLIHCTCFNDNLLVLAVSHLGAKWDLIKQMDSIMNKDRAQFTFYTASQLEERWTVSLKVG